MDDFRYNLLRIRSLTSRLRPPVQDLGVTRDSVVEGAVSPRDFEEVTYMVASGEKHEEAECEA